MKQSREDPDLNAPRRHGDPLRSAPGGRRPEAGGNRPAMAGQERTAASQMEERGIRRRQAGQDQATAESGAAGTSGGYVDASDWHEGAYRPSSLGRLDTPSRDDEPPEPRRRRRQVDRGERLRALGAWFAERPLRFIAPLIILATLVIAVLLIASFRPPEPVEPEETFPNPVATITMSDGSQMRFELYPDQAPNTVANFVRLANSRYYDGLQFFRVVSNVLIQGGDPKNDGTGDPGYAIVGEFADNGYENNISHVRGAISMARQTGYDTAGSQFFIMQGSYPTYYDGHYAAFGMILTNDSSLATLDAIGAQPVDSSDVPITRQVISSIRVETFGAEYEPETTERPR